MEMRDDVNNGLAIYNGRTERRVHARRIKKHHAWALIQATSICTPALSNSEATGHALCTCTK